MMGSTVGNREHIVLSALRRAVAAADTNYPRTRYGKAREIILGLEITLPDCELWNGLYWSSLLPVHRRLVQALKHAPDLGELVNRSCLLPAMGEKP